jgi:RNA polymerase sigma-54 factor
MLSTLKSLNPKPAADWFSTPASYIIPDVFVKASTNGSYRVELNNMSLPRLLINQTYYAELKQNKTAARYLKENLSHANFLIKALHQRATTILRVTEEIVLRQYQFFEQGIEHLKPLTLKDIAESLEINESTVSRVTSNKYMSTPRGLFELKYFFSQAAGSYIGNTDTSTTAIKHKIKQLIDNETPANILSDDKLVELLGQEGIKIARRTIAKYREALGIETSAQRKRLKRI